MNYKKHLKQGIRLIIEGDGNPITIIMRLSKGQLIKVLDTILPDEEETDPEPQPTTWEPLDLRKMK
jgi:hypothetical protein